MNRHKICEIWKYLKINCGNQCRQSCFKLSSVKILESGTIASSYNTVKLEGEKSQGIQFKQRTVSKLFTDHLTILIQCTDLDNQPLNNQSPIYL